MENQKNRYLSRYAKSQYVKAPHYITEFVCENRARSLKRDLPMQFWLLEEWGKYYKWQIGLAFGLLKKYSAAAIIKVVRTKRIWSLKPAWVIEEIEKEHMRLVEKQAKNDSVKHKFQDNTNSTGKPKKPKNKFEGLS